MSLFILQTVQKFGETTGDALIKGNSTTLICASALSNHWQVLC